MALTAQICRPLHEKRALNFQDLQKWDQFPRQALEKLLNLYEQVYACVKGKKDRASKPARLGLDEYIFRAPGFQVTDSVQVLKTPSYDYKPCLEYNFKLLVPALPTNPQVGHITYHPLFNNHFATPLLYHSRWGEMITLTGLQSRNVLDFISFSFKYRKLSGMSFRSSTMMRFYRVCLLSRH